MDDIERLSYEECFETIEKGLLTCQLHFASTLSPFYKEKFKKSGISQDHVSNIDTFTHLPFTDKDEILEEQENYPPYGRLAGKTILNKLRRVHITSGSTGKPIYIILTENDLEATVEAGRRTFRCAGLTPADTVIHCLNYNLWAGGVTDHLNLEATGATVIPFGVGNSKKLIKTILDLRPTAISCTPSYLSRLEYLLKEEFKLFPEELGLEKGFFGGEGGLQNPKVRARIEETWKMKAIDANYGMADVLSMFGSECDTRDGLHFHGQGILYLELIDPVDNKNIPIREGQVGEMVLTNLRREAQPLIRFRTKDMIKIVSTKKCRCGRNSLRFLVEGRTDDMITVKSINVFPNAVGNVLSEKPEWFSGEFEFILDSPPPHERPIMRVELATKSKTLNKESLESYLLQKCRDELTFTPRLEFIPFGKFPRTTGKTQRVKKIYG